VRILVLTSSYPKYPGDATAPFIESITSELASRGHELTVVLPARPDLSPASVPGVSFEPYHYAPTKRLAVFGYAEALRGDVAVRPSTYLVSPLAIASGVAKTVEAVRRDGYDLLHAHWVVPNGAMALPAARRGGLPLVVSLHGSDVFLSEKKRILGRAARLVFRRAAAVTACSDDLAERSQALGASPRPVVIPYGVDAASFQPAREDVTRLRERLGLAAAQPMVLAVGRLVHKKGFEILVEAIPRLVARHSDLKVVIAGGGDLAASLAAQAEASGVRNHLVLVGKVSREELPAYYGAATVTAVPSIHDDAGNVDGLPNVMLEALASGSSIVASAVAGIPQAVSHRKEALLVPERDPKALAEAILELLSSPDARELLGRNARERARSVFSWGRVGDQFEDVFRTVTRSRGAAS
jgi:glycosyltransferase involved in cell wall biosynthesis